MTTPPPKKPGILDKLKSGVAGVANAATGNKTQNKSGSGKKDNKKEDVDLRENRLSEQAALILSIDEILNLTVDKQKNVNPLQKVYKNFAPIRYATTGSEPPTGHFFLTSNLTKNANMQVFFNSLPPQVLSLLIPSIKIYKSFIPDINLAAKTPKVESYDWRVPFDNVPVRYGVGYNKDTNEYTNEFTSEFVAKSTEDILSGRSSFRTAGIMSFSYEYVGTNPAEINTNIHAKLKLFFHSPRELVERISVDIGDPRFIKQPPSGRDLTFSYSDLINQASRAYKDPATGEQFANQEYYRLKIECGYAEINEKMLTDVIENYYLSTQSIFDQQTLRDYVTQIINAIKSSKVVLFLSPYKYDLNFQENSTITLDISFNASMDAMMTSQDADIFMLTEASSKIEETVKNFQTFLELQSKVQNIKDPKSNLSALDPCIDIKKLNEYFKEFKEKNPTFKDKTKEQIIDSLNKQKAIAFNSLSDFFAGKTLLHSTYSGPKPVVEPRVYNATFNPDILGIKRDKNTTNGIEQRIKALQSGKKVVSVEPIAIDSANIANTSSLATKNKKSKTPAPVDLAQQPLASIDEKTVKYKAGAQTYNIRFVLLGDILDIALNTFEKISPESDIPKVILGSIPLNLPDPTLKDIIGAKNFYDTKERFYNLADIPISYNLFQEFLIKNIVKSNKTRYPVLQFIKDIISQLIVPATAPSVLGLKNAINSSIRVSTAYFTFNTEGQQDPLNVDDPASQKTYPSPITEEMVSKLEKKLANVRFNQFSPVKPEQSPLYVNYMFLYCSSRFPKNITGDEKVDLQRGVFHFRMGTDSGIVKKISFAKVDIPYQREMLARREGNRQGTTLKQFYNASIEMFGNNIFRPGDYIYVNPNYMFYNVEKDAGVAAAKNKNIGTQLFDLQGALGLGGYYLVTKVSTDISDINYTTKLECSFQAQKIDGEVRAINDTKCKDRK